MAIQMSYLEKDVEDLLEASCQHYLKLTFISRQFKTPVGIVDIIARRHKRLYYVIEIKKGIVDVNAFVQVLRYTKWLNSEYAKNGRRLFVPLLIGSHLHPDLVTVCEKFDQYPGYLDLIGRVFYSLFCFDPIRGVNFNWMHPAENHYHGTLLKKFNHVQELWSERDILQEKLWILEGEQDGRGELPALQLVKSAGVSQ